jgi:DNA mismatch endonuclease (patch repair protein)
MCCNVFVVDHLDQAKRSLNMAAVRSKDTKPEMAVRQIVYSLGYRYRLHLASLPGKPDLAFPAKRRAIFVHGCFWHRHRKCKYATNPKTRVDFWENKFRDNVERDRRARRELKKLGWTVMTIWQCDLKDKVKLKENLTVFLADRCP